MAATALFAANAQAEAEVRLKHLLELRGIGLLTGESGSGKTTLLSLIAGLDLPDTGEILLDGENLCRSRLTEQQSRRYAKHYR